MSDPKCARMLLDRARSDLIALGALEEATPRVRDESFGFHVQQAAEKSLKAWLAVLGLKYPLTHELDLLLKRLEVAGASTGFFRSVADFTPYAVQFRYEGVGPDHEPIDRAAAIALVSALAAHVADLLADTDRESAPA